MLLLSRPVLDKDALGLEMCWLVGFFFRGGLKAEPVLFTSLLFSSLPSLSLSIKLID